MQNFERRAARGFSYVWTLATVAIISAGTAKLLELESTAIQRSKERELLSIGRQFRDALKSYGEASSMDGLDRYPQHLADLISDDRAGSPRRHLRKVFTDPMTGRAEWGLIRIQDRIVAVHSLSTEKPIKSARSRSEEWSFGKAQTYSEWIFSAFVLQPEGIHDGQHRDAGTGSAADTSATVY